MCADGTDGWCDSRRVSRALPDGARVALGRAVVMCRNYPRVQVSPRDGEQGLYVQDGVLILEHGCAFDGHALAGAYKLAGRWISARHVRILPYKARGSRNHHKFVVAITDGVVS